MQILVPNYYQQFQCIAEQCKHNCCIGWEIDIDDITMDYYRSLKDDFGASILENIAEEEEPHFVLKEGDRCPFLNEKGLCDIILNLGKDALCGICTDHPRFRNFYTNFVEMGLGLCCEEAARIVLNSKKPFALFSANKKDIQCTTEEEYYLTLREELFTLMQNRNVSMLERFSALAQHFGFDFTAFSMKELCAKYLDLERLDSKWTGLLENLKDFSLDFQIFEEELAIPFEQLVCYFLFRHFTEARWNGDISQRVRMILSGCYLIGGLCGWHLQHCGTVTIKDMEEYVRMYSAEIEYSEENIDSLLNF
ncbi:MAG: flagellin lysine-N-methylase [Clostridia bacterium]|nr:flagellin lysine-N-methylase [Clostridia bacterium]